MTDAAPPCPSPAARLGACRGALAALRAAKRRQEEALQDLRFKLLVMNFVCLVDDCFSLDHTRAEANCLDPRLNQETIPSSTAIERVALGTHKRQIDRGFFFRQRLKNWDINKVVDRIYGIEFPQSVVATVVSMDNGQIEQWKSNPIPFSNDINYLKSLVMMDKMNDGLSLDGIKRSMMMVSRIPDDFDLVQQYQIYIRNLASKKMKDRGALIPFERNDFVKDISSSITRTWMEKIKSFMYCSEIRLPAINAGLPNGYLSYIMPKGLSRMKDRELSAFLRFCNLLDPVIWMTDDPDTEFFNLLKILRGDKPKSSRKKDHSLSKGKNLVVSIMGNWIKLLKSREPNMLRCKFYAEAMGYIMGLKGYPFDFALRTRDMGRFDKYFGYGNTLYLRIGTRKK